MSQSTVNLQDTKGDDWNKLAGDYLKIAEQTSIASIGMMLERANAFLPFSKATGILDNGCGPGPVMSRLLKDHGSEIPADCTLTCADFSDGMLAQVKGSKERAGSNSPWARVEIKNQNAMDLTEIADGSKSHVTAGMVYFMVPDPQKALSESLRVLKPDGVLTLSAWEGSQWMDVMNLVPKVRPDKIMPTMPQAWQSADGIHAELEKAGFRDVEARECPVKMPIGSHEEFAGFMLTRMPHMVKLTGDMSEEEVGKLKEMMVSKLQEMAPEKPYALDGVALVGVGTK